MEIGSRRRRRPGRLPSRCGSGSYTRRGTWPVSCCPTATASGRTGKGAASGSRLAGPSCRGASMPDDPIDASPPDSSPITQQTEEFQVTNDNPAEMVPLALIAAELDEPLEDLARRLGDDVMLDDVGLRTVTVDVARELIVEYRTRQLV